MRYRDTKIDEAKAELQKFFNKNAEEVFYIKQVEVLHEKKFFHWIISRAINELISENKLKSKFEPLLGETKVKFIFNKKYRYYKRDLKKKIEIIRKYSQPEIAKACGRQAEVLFLNAFAFKGFKILGENTNEFMGKKWKNTSHNLDFIIEKDNIHYGCEVKNTFDYIDKDEMFTKLKICEYLGIKPLFIMRFSPKTYIWEIAKRGGYSMIFESQIYPFGFEYLVNDIKNILKLPVDCPRAIPEGIINRFLKWHNKQNLM